MTQEELQKALEAISKSGITVAGDLVMEKKVEYEVNNVEKGGIGIQINGGKVSEKDKGHNKGGRPKRTGETINKTFIYDADDETNKRLQYFYNALKAFGWIDVGTDLKEILIIFSGKETERRVVWTGGINTLTELFRELVQRKQLVKLPEGESIWMMVNARFWDNKHNVEFGNRKLGGTRTPVESKETIDLLVKIMDSKISIAEVVRMLQSQKNSFSVRT